MLSAQSAPVVKATLPVVGASLTTVTELFYRRMFEERPELLRHLFNRTNQATGAQREALAGSVAAFATLLVERPGDRPDAVLARIAHKHVSLGITADQYPLVGRHLLGAVAEVLGDAVTPEVAAAWDEVYWLMANALIAIEARLYTEAGVEDGDVWRRMEIAERHQETPDAVSLVLRRTDDRPTAPFRPGQYVGVRVELPDGAHQIRQYSLSTAPDHKTWRITVKRERAADGYVPDGEVSSWLHAHAEVGDLLDVSLPAGDLVPPEAGTPLFLASAGIGITPMLSMLDHLALTSSSRPVTVVHADRSPLDHVHRDEQADLVSRLTSADLHLWYENDAHLAPGARVHAGRATLDHLTLAPDTTAYLCGPLPFMRLMRGELLAKGLHPSAVHYEVFGPDLWLGE
ncbi:MULTISPECIES: globin domain-containing protein [Streptomyces]|uniref:Flavohemoprotein n=1 Tax=Streptomyces stelliscabiei TaxID=146820 RepID=A0A8I0NY85_9ACTN|nr:MULTISPECIES: globin domain-containing protein [Streptomyces]KND43170.1 hemin transporter [Streptomyces stelliscabiei]MBE1594715.1 nitric oxide dioxygenase [Streptomyces stelliscabiei]MDX2518996.1 FAD-binding oxidoreductase [Streptomyces stelliscabiei]MDX2550852.1 FAD-binding oxidoreductase [Streptomyces stelliscabiei]MDX2616666.1 FAD-binding oxidoreductase [Streptomyces stelliscabiei]